MSVDRKSRDKLIQAIDQFLNEEITAFEFNDLIFSASDKTSDLTIKETVYQLWSFYDDITDHHVRMHRHVWNYIQRLRLILASDATLISNRVRIWHGSQAIAMVALAVFFWAALVCGWDSMLYLVTLPLGFLSIGLYYWRTKIHRSLFAFDPVLTPFSSVSEIFSLAEKLPNYRKQKYPRHLKMEFEEHSDQSSFAEMGPTYLKWLLYSPIVLLFQLLPVSVDQPKVVV